MTALDPTLETETKRSGLRCSMAGLRAMIQSVNEREYINFDG